MRARGVICQALSVFICLVSASSRLQTQTRANASAAASGISRARTHARARAASKSSIAASQARSSSASAATPWAKMPAKSFGSVPTPAIVSPIEFTMGLADYRALGGHMDRVRRLGDVLASQAYRLVEPAADNPWPLLRTRA